MTRRMEGCPPLEDREGSEGWGWERASRLRWGAKGQDAVTRDLAVMLEGGADTQRPGVRRPREKAERRERGRLEKGLLTILRIHCPSLPGAIGLPSLKHTQGHLI
jgi:hypothetical protein